MKNNCKTWKRKKKKERPAITNTATSNKSMVLSNERLPPVDKNKISRF